MANSKVRCSRCKQYIDRDDVYLTLPVGRYCSAECVNEEQKVRRQAAKPRGKKVPAGQEAYQAAIHRRDGQCRCCGKSRGVQVHHIVFRSQSGGDEHENLILLCWRHHQTLAHGSQARWFRQAFQEYIRVYYAEGRRLTITEAASRLEPNPEAEAQLPCFQDEQLIRLGP